MDLGVQEGLLRAIYAAHNGVYRMSADMEDLVETSNNIARVIVKDGEISIQNLTRSSVESSKMDLANGLRSAYELFGCEVDFAYNFRGTQVYVEAKGGLQGEGKRPGAKRTDNVKKAIANAALIKSRYPETRYIVYFSDLPKYGSSSHKMLKTAVRAGFIDSVRYLINIR